MIFDVVSRVLWSALSIEESEYPQRNLVPIADVALVDGIERLCFALQFCTVFGNLEFQLLVHQEGAEIAMLVHLMVFPERVAEECLQHIVLVETAGIEAVHQVGVVEQHTSWLLGKFVAFAINHVDQPSFFQVLDVVHHCGAAHAQFLCQLAHIGHTAATGGEHVEKLLDFCQIFQFNLLHQQDVHLNHHVHVLQQVLAVVCLVEEEGVESVVQVGLEILSRIDLFVNLCGNLAMIGYDFLKRVGTQLQARGKVEKFAEGEASQVVRLHNAVEFRVFFLQPHDGRASENDFQPRVAVIAFAQLCAPVGLFEHLVDEQHLAARVVELACKFSNADVLDVKVVSVDVQTRMVVRGKMLLGILQKERGFSYAASTLDANHSVFPVDLVHQVTTHGSFQVLY